MKSFEEIIRTYTAPEGLAALRFYGMGFTVGRTSMDDSLGNHAASDAGWIVVVTEFTCICGRQERFRRMGCRNDFEAGRINFFRELVERTGALSRAHLLGDGYTDEQIDAMEARCEHFLDTCAADVVDPLLTRALLEVGNHMPAELAYAISHRLSISRHKHKKWERGHGA